ncbi:MAG: hypothetical protein QXW18_00115 [Candidatus Bathyarchaeia archaeon]
MRKATVLYTFLIFSLVSLVILPASASKNLATGHSQVMIASSADPMFKCSKVERVVAIDPWGSIHVSDTYYIKNVGSYSSYSITLALPNGAQNVTASDLVGPISSSYKFSSDSASTTAIVDFRYPIQPQESYIFTIGYNIPTKIYITQVRWDFYNFKFPLILNSPDLIAPIESVIITVILPEGAECDFSTISPSPTQVKRGALQQEFSLTFQRVNLGQSYSLTADYRYNLFWATFRPFLWLGLIIVTVFAANMVRRTKLAPPPPMPIPSTRIYDFVEKYDEKIALVAELESLERKAAAGKIPKHEYKRRGRIIEARISTLDKELGELKKILKAIGPRFADAIGKIEVAEAELPTVRRDLAQLEAQYRAGKISKEAFDRLGREYQKRIDRARTVIDKVIIELREEIR